MYHIVDVVHVLGALVARAHDDGLVVLQVLLCHALHVAAHCSREHQRRVTLRECLENLVDSLREAHVQHLVGLVEHDVRHVLQVGEAAVLQVEESSRCGHDDLCPLAQCPHLRLDGRSAVDRLYVQPVDIAAEVAQVVGYLQAQLARRREHQRLCVAVAQVESHQQRQSERRRLSRSRLCQCYHVASVLQQVGNDGLLYRHGLYKSHLANGAANLLADAQFFKTLHHVCKDSSFSSFSYAIFHSVMRRVSEEKLTPTLYIVRPSPSKGFAYSLSSICCNAMSALWSIFSSKI